MTGTSGYQAGYETNNTQISYGAETVWGTAPAVQFQAIRYVSETLAFNKTRQRPSEINLTREAAQGVTTQQTATGAINGALSFKTYDDLWSSCFNADWGAAISISSITTDTAIVKTGGVITMTSTLAGKFSPLPVGTWFYLFGAVAPGNNGWYYVSVHTSDVLITVTGPTSLTASSETSAAGNIQIRGGTLKNGTTFKSLYLQQLFSSTVLLEYPGAYVTRITLSGGIGNFFTCNHDIVAQKELKATSNASTGAVLAAPTGRVMDPVTGAIGAFWNQTVVGTAVDQFTITLENTGAASEYGLGSVSAQGILAGTFTASGTFRAYFKDFSQYDLFTAETSGNMTFLVKDNTNQTYAFQFLNAILAAGGPSVGGPGQPVYQTFTLEGGPASGGGTFQIDRMVAV